MSRRLSYTLLSPFYDIVVERALHVARLASLASLPRDGRSRVLLNGVRSGLDLPLLPAGHGYVGLDLTRAMLARSLRRAWRRGSTFEISPNIESWFPDPVISWRSWRLIIVLVFLGVLAVQPVLDSIFLGGSV